MKKIISIIVIFILIVMLGFGIAYAYFAARIIGQENASTISLTGGKMIIEYSENSDVIELSGIYPKTSPWATKIITIKGTNTTDLIMKYDLGLNVTANTFKNSYISYDLKLIDGDNGAPISNITGKYINGTGYKRFGIGSFANANEEVHQYELKIYFKNNGKDQNDAQRAIFNARVVISDVGSENPNEERAMFLSGTNVNIKMKTLANLANNDNTEVTSYNVNDTYITAIKESATEPTSDNKEEKNIVSLNNDFYPIPIYMWYDDGTIYWWSEDKHPYLASSSTFIFYQLKSLTNIEGLSNFDVSKVVNALSMFTGDPISDLQPIANWDVSNLDTAQDMFDNTNISSLSYLANWNTSKIRTMRAMFRNNSSLTDISGISNWDVSKVTNMSDIFGNTKLSNLSGIEYWDVSNATDISNFIHNTSSLTDISAISNWNVSKVTNMNNMFSNCTSLTDASPINNWDINLAATFTRMFQNTPTHPEFTKVQGTWDNVGTFTPNS